MAPMEATLAVRDEEGLPHMVIALRVVVYILAGITTLVCCLRVSPGRVLAKGPTANNVPVVYTEIRGSILSTRRLHGYCCSRACSISALLIQN